MNSTQEQANMDICKAQYDTWKSQYESSDTAITTITQTDNTGGWLPPKSSWADFKVEDYISPIVNNQILVLDSLVLQFDDGSSVTGAELKIYMKILRKIVEQDYPEELF